MLEARRPRALSPRVTRLPRCPASRLAQGSRRGACPAPTCFVVLRTGIAHRDLKPENILCEHPNQVSGAGGRPSPRARAAGRAPALTAPAPPSGLPREDLRLRPGQRNQAQRGLLPHLHAGAAHPGERARPARPSRGGPATRGGRRRAEAPTDFGLPRSNSRGLGGRGTPPLAPAADWAGLACCSGGLGGAGRGRGCPRLT